MKKILAISASPNTEKDDVITAFRTLIQPWTWSDKSSVQKLEDKIKSYFDLPFAYGFDSARSGLMMLLKAYGIGPGDQVMLHGFTCLVVANPVLWVGAKPVYIDIDPKTYNFELNDLRKKFNPKVKAIIVQHTFGIAEEINEIRKIVGPQVVIIEDLAHGLGLVERKSLGDAQSDALVLTFGIEKIISGVRAGMVVFNDEDLALRMTDMHNALPDFPRAKTFVSLLHPLLWWIILPTYNWGLGNLTLGKLLIIILRWLRLLGNVIEPIEYKAMLPVWMPCKMSAGLARLVLNQWKKLSKYNNHRMKITSVYQEKFNLNYTNNNGLLRFPIQVQPQKRKKVITKLKKNGIIPGDWYKTILYAPKSTQDLLLYQIGTCPNAERAAMGIINLPTGIDVKITDAGRIAEIVKPFLEL